MAKCKACRRRAVCGAILHRVDINYPVVSTVRGWVACAAHCLLPCRYAVRCTISWDQPWSLLCALFWPRNELLGSAAISCQPLCCFWSYRFRNVLLGRQLESEALIHWYCCSGDALHKCRLGKAVEEPASFFNCCTALSCLHHIHMKSLLLLALGLRPSQLSWLSWACTLCRRSILSKQFCVVEVWRRENQTQFSFAVSCTVEPPVVSMVTFRWAGQHFLVAAFWSYVCSASLKSICWPVLSSPGCLPIILLLARLFEAVWSLVLL